MAPAGAAGFPRIVGVAFVMSMLLGSAYELIRLVGGRVLLSVMLGRYRRPTREERVLLFLVGSTSLAELMGELRMQELLTRFFFDIDAVIRAHGGEVHAYVGDEVIVTWRVTAKPSARRYIECFFAIQDRIAEQSRSVSSRIRDRAKFSRRIACRLGGGQRMRRLRRQIAYFGDTVNVAGAIAGALQTGRTDPARISRPGATGSSQR